MKSRQIMIEHPVLMILWSLEITILMNLGARDAPDARSSIEKSMDIGPMMQKLALFQ